MGGALGQWWTRAGHAVTFGFARAADTLDVAARAAGPPARVAASREALRAAVREADAVMLAVPWDALDAALDAAFGDDAPDGLPVLTCVSNLRPEPSGRTLGLPAPAGVSPAAYVAKRLPRARVVEAFNTTFADLLRQRLAGASAAHAGPPPSIWYCGDDAGARAVAATLIEACGCAPVDAGPLAAAPAVETFATAWVQLALATGRYPTAALLVADAVVDATAAPAAALTIAADPAVPGGTVVLEVWTVDAARQADALARVAAAARQRLAPMEGFAGSAVFRSLDGERIACYSRWRDGDQREGARADVDARSLARALPDLAAPDTHAYHVALSAPAGRAVHVTAGATPLWVIATFAVQSEHQAALEALERAEAAHAVDRPGILSATFHRSLDGVRMVNVAAVADQAAVDALARQPRFAADADAYWRALARNEYHVYAAAEVIPAPAGVPAHAHALGIARRAFDAFRRGHATADWSPFLALLTDDVVIWLPGGPSGGRNDGHARAEAFVRSLSAEPGTAMTFGDPYRTTSDGSTVSFELEDAGRLGGQPVRNRIVMSFDVRGDSVCALREYLGVLPPTADPPPP
jgi:hypothetical protein